MKATVEGIQRGHLLLGALTENGGDKYLFTVTRVLGKHSVLAIAHLGSMTCEITLTTNGISREDSPWKRVGFSQSDRADGVLGVIR